MAATCVATSMTADARQEPAKPGLHLAGFPARSAAEFHAIKASVLLVMRGINVPRIADICAKTAGEVK